MSDINALGVMLQESARKYKKKEAIIFEGREISYRELDENANKVANGLASLGIGKGDRVALMLPNIPEFVYSFFGIQKLGAVAVPFNTMYKGREITFILNDCGAKAIITLTNFANLINEIKYDCPELKNVLVTGQRTLVFVEPDVTANVQIVVEKAFFESADDAFQKTGAVLVDVLKSVGVADAWYKHQGSLRASGKKIATILISEVENLFVINSVLFLNALDTDPFFKVVWVPPEVKDKVLEPMTSVFEQTGKQLSLEQFKDAVVEKFSASFGIEIAEGQMKRDELFGYQKNRALAYRV